MDLVTGSAPAVDPQQKRRRLLVAVGLLIVGVIAVTVRLTSKSAQPTASVATPAASTVSLDIHASPPEAKIRIDGKEYDQAAVSLTLPRDDQPHQIVVFADGFVPDTRAATFDKSLSVDVALRAIEPAHAPDTTGTVEAPASSSTHAKSAASWPTPTRHAAPDTSAAPVVASPDCSPPYFFDHGIKTYKPQCL